MSTAQAPQRPVFNSLDPGLDAELSPPISGWSIVALLLGIFSLTSIFSMVMIPLAIGVFLFCLFVIWRLSRDPTVGGLRLAQIGLTLSVLGASCVYASTYSRDAFLYKQAAEHAKVFLKVLSSGKSYEAFELTLAEVERQITGTDIEAHYKALVSAEYPTSQPGLDMSNMPSSSTMKNSRIKEEVTEFMRSASTMEILKHGEGAEWEFVRGSRITWPNSGAAEVSVVMQDRVTPGKKIEVRLSRQTYGMQAEPGQPPVALWKVDKANLARE